MKNKDMITTAVIVALSMLFILLVGVSIEVIQEHEEIIYELRQENNEVEDMYQKSLHHIKMMNGEKFE